MFFQSHNTINKLLCIYPLLLFIDLIFNQNLLLAQTPEDVFGMDTIVIINNRSLSSPTTSITSNQNSNEPDVSLDINLSNEIIQNLIEDNSDIKMILQDLNNLINELKKYYRNLYYKDVKKYKDKESLSRLRQRFSKILEQNVRNNNYHIDNTTNQQKYIEYVVKPGDSLWKISKMYLGKGSLYPKLIEANKDRYPSLLKNPNLIHAGWRLRIPTSENLASSSTSSNVSQTQQTSSNVPLSTSSTTNTTNQRTYEKGGKALYNWLQQAGLSGEKLRMAWAIGMAESGGDPRALNNNPATGDYSFGLFQINMIGNLGPARRRQFNLKSNEDLFDPMTNIRVMLAISNNCTNWRPWGAYLNGSYRKYYNMFPPK